MRSSFVLAAFLIFGTRVAAAQPADVRTAIANGDVGERYDGYMGVANPSSDAVRRQVIAINIRRKTLYTNLASERGVSVQIVGFTTACRLFAQLPVGSSYLLKDGQWRRRAPGETVPVPDHCR